MQICKLNLDKLNPHDPEPKVFEKNAGPNRIYRMDRKGKTK
jgi:hypothetical protein